MHHLDTERERHDGVGDAHAEVLVEVRFEALLDAALHLLHEVLHGVRRDDAEGVDQRQRVHVAFLADLLDQVERPLDFGAREVDREEHHFEAVVVRELCGLDRGFDRLLQRPAIGELEHVLARRDLHDDAVDAGVDRALDVFLHAPREGEDLGPEVALDDFLDGVVVGRRHDRHAGFDAVDAGFGEALGDADLFVLGKNNAGLLLAVAQRYVVDLDIFRELKILRHLRRVIPFTNEPVVGFPGGWVGHPCNSSAWLGRLLSGRAGRWQTALAAACIDIRQDPAEIPCLPTPL